MKRLTREWIDKAEDDFRVARSNMRSRKSRVPDAICFHRQQTAEKLLKARLCEDGGMHCRNLLQLGQQLLPCLPMTWLGVLVVEMAAHFCQKCLSHRFASDCQHRPRQLDNIEHI